jgi:hypothetical protein
MSRSPIADKRRRRYRSVTDLSEAASREHRSNRMQQKGMARKRQAVRFNTRTIETGATMEKEKLVICWLLGMPLLMLLLLQYFLY